MFFFFRLLSRLPLRWVHRIGALLGWGAYLLSPTYRKHLRENMTQAGIPAQLRGRIIGESGKQAIEPACIWLRPLEEVRALAVEVSGWEHVEAAQAAGRGVIYLTPHLGCFEMIGQYISQFGKFTALYRVPKRQALHELIQLGRIRGNQHLAPADLSGVRALIKALRQGQAVGMLPDQAPKEGEGIWLDYFGRPAYTMTLAARLTETAATTLMTWGERLPDGRGYRLHFQPPSVPFSGDTLARAAQINREMEALIRQCPQQYLWGYHRYKRPKRAEPPPALADQNLQEGV